MDDMTATLGSWQDTALGQFDNYWASLALYLPLILGTLAILLVGYVIARVLRSLIVKSFATLGVDKLGDMLASSFGIEKMPFRTSGMIGKAAFWLILLAFFTFAADFSGLQGVSDLIKSIISFLPNALVAAILMIIGVLIADFAKSIVCTATVSAGLDYGDTLGQIVRIAILVMVGLMALDQLGIDMTLVNRIIQIFLMAGGGALAIAVGFGARRVAGAIISGMYARDQFNVGDHIKVGAVEGEIVAVTAVTTTIEQADGSWVHYPNEKLISSTSQTKSV